MNVILIIAGVLALVATVLAFIFIVPEEKSGTLSGFGKTLHNIVNFKSLIIEKILQALYIFSTATVIMTGFCMLFWVERVYTSYYSSKEIWMGGYGILLMLLGPIVLRLVYEAVIMFILLVKNVIQINNKLSDKTNDKSDITERINKDNGSGTQSGVYSQPSKSESKGNSFCPNCGAKVGDGAYCGQCAAKLR